jgi:hypothetical protein
MKHIKLFESFNNFPNTKEEIDEICRKYNINNYTINRDMSIDVNGDVNLTFEGFTKLPLKFNKVIGNFNCVHNNLSTLEGAPKEVIGNFNCGYNNLTKLKGAPKKVNKFFCSNNQLTTLYGSPKKVYGFDCTNNELNTLKGSPESVSDWFYCDYNKLTTLDGGPKEIGGSIFLHFNPVKSLYKLFNFDYKWFMSSIDEYSWLDGTTIYEMRLVDVFLDDDKPYPDLSSIDKIYTIR